MGAESIGDKVAHVKRAGQSRNHTCHWPGCARQVPPAMWGCRTHWFRLPAAIRSAIFRAYQIGQENTSLLGGDGQVHPSRAYVDAANAAQAWIAEHLKGTLL